jgi:hypothetical protein
MIAVRLLGPVDVVDDEGMVRPVDRFVAGLDTTSRRSLSEEKLHFRRRTLEILRSHSPAKEWMARGAAMDRYEIVQYALAALDD